MNPSSESELQAMDLQDLIDALVGGEFDQQQIAQTLRRFQNEPEAWRQCTLAFVESQVWRTACKQLTREPVKPSAALSDDLPTSRFGWRSLLAVAAIMMLSLMVGWQLARTRQSFRGCGAAGRAAT